MSYCINPNCSNRNNSDDRNFCQTCGTKLLINDRYHIVAVVRIGQVYNSEVFEVKDLNERGKLKIIKSLSPKFNNSKAAELFEKEAQVLIWLSADWHHYPGIPQVKPDAYFSWGIGNGLKQIKCLVMEKIEGENLEQWREQNQYISQEKAIDWLQQLTNILDKVHQQGLWHRDIKPSNIMLKPDGKLVLIDFGAVGVGRTIIASAEYTPPEQIRGETVLQSDFFALGRTFVYLLTGKHPHDLPKSSTDEKLLWRNELPKISASLADLIDDLMANCPENRPKNTQEIWQHLQSINNSQQLIFNPTENLSSINNSSYPITSIPVTTLTNSDNLQQISSSEPQKLKRQVIITGSLTAMLGLAITVYQLVPCHLKQCLPINTHNISFGEKILVPDSTRQKLAAVKAISAGNYPKAVKLFEQSLALRKTTRKH